MKNKINQPKARYKIGDVLFYFEEGKIKSVVVRYVMLSTTGVYYKYYLVDDWLEEKDLYNSKKGALAQDFQSRWRW